jgi:hypothetical protein
MVTNGNILIRYCGIREINSAWLLLVLGSAMMAEMVRCGDPDAARAEQEQGWRQQRRIGRKLNRHRDALDHLSECLESMTMSNASQAKLGELVRVATQVMSNITPMQYQPNRIIRGVPNYLQKVLFRVNVGLAI